QLVAPSPLKWLKYWQGALAIQQRTGNKPSKIKQKASLPVQFQVTPYTTSLLETVSPYGMDDLNTKMLEDLLMKLPMLLHYEDRNSMAFSLESRLPFLDYRLVEFAFSLPHSYKIHQAKTKRLLVETMKDALPREILARKDKMGYETPGQNWFQGAETQLALQRFLHTPPAVFESLPPVFKETLDTLWQQCVAGVPLHSAKVKILWRYFTACIWWEKVAGKNTARKALKTDSFLSNH
ncbi:MAG: asparagine synthase C-terminal domain-containing protein, partial [Cyanobacteria bacterium]|nr:asparagine synthase C-terminal domain-containing protein [Cyanobacteriota bacterium]